MSVLDRIIADKKREVSLKKNLVSTADLERQPLFARPCQSLSKSLKSREPAIIAEHKRRSPSKAVINQSLSVDFVVKGYQEAGAAGLSILTDGKYFGGSSDDLLLARATGSLPILRKDFIVDAYQILESKAMGADAILLIAAALHPGDIKRFSEVAASIGLESILEVHNREELEQSLTPAIQIVGVNNRDLKTFNVSLEVSRHLSAYIPSEFVRVSESGINSPEDVLTLSRDGFQGFLIGENFMKTENPGLAISQFINALRT